MFLTPLRCELTQVPGNWVLLCDLVWERWVGEELELIVAPEGFVTDFASVPVVRPVGRSERPAVIHDWLYKMGSVSRIAADKLFVDMLAAEGVSAFGRWIYYAGVRMGGRWPYNQYRRRK